MNKSPELSHDTCEDEKTLRIRTLNDTFRTTFVGGHVIITQGIQTLGTENAKVITDKIKAYNSFTPDNDPYGEHDFGAVTHDRQNVFWKIDYYDPTMTYLSDDPSNSEQTLRVLTVMLAEEY